MTCVFRTRDIPPVFRSKSGSDLEYEWRRMANPNLGYHIRNKEGYVPLPPLDTLVRTFAAKWPMS